jgi:hypothetical protein
MKRSTANIFEVFSADTLNKQEMQVIFGGVRPKGKSKDKDVFDEEDED